MVKKLTLLMFMALLALPVAAMAQFQAGDKEFTISGSGRSDNDLDNNNFNMQFSLGYFFSEMLEGLLRQEASFSDTEEGGDWRATTSLGADFHFDLERWQPFLGASVGYRYGDETDETWFGGPEAGLKYFVNTTTFVQGLVQYQWFFEDVDEADNNADDGDFIYALGLGFRF